MPLPAIAAVEAGLGVIQAGIGIVQSIKAKKEQKRLLAQREAYQTPEEIYKILEATQQNASQGYDATTLNYLTNETDRAFSSSISAATRLGGNPNDLSALFDQKVNQIMKIGAENHQLNMSNFGAYLGALESVASNKAAEQKSKQDILKDRLQAEGLNLQSAAGNISGGFNTATSALSAAQIAQLYNPDGTLKVKTNQPAGIGSQMYGYGVTPRGWTA